MTTIEKSKDDVKPNNAKSIDKKYFFCQSKYIEIL